VNTSRPPRLATSPPHQLRWPILLPIFAVCLLLGACAPALPARTGSTASKDPSASAGEAASLPALAPSAYAAMPLRGGSSGAGEPLAAAPRAAEQVAPPTPRPRPTATPTPPPPVQVREVAPPRITAQLAVVIDEASGAVLYGLREHEEVQPASLTKIVTAMVALEAGNPAARVTSDVDSRTMWEDSVMGLQPGEELSLEDLLYGLMLPSGNDAALAIARYVAHGNEQVFMELMNAKVRQLGLRHTHFMNPHGRDVDGHYSSPYDMAMLARAAMRNPAFQRLASAREWDASGFLRDYHLVNLNRLLWQYPGADGVKIGYETRSGQTMVVSAVRNGHRLYASFMRATNMRADGAALLDYAFDTYAWQ
jgi:serine-type D-Ala-D-Ala carboxypeptidase (penicillin-binding protein 5/6)